MFPLASKSLQALTREPGRAGTVQERHPDRARRQAVPAPLPAACSCTLGSALGRGRGLGRKLSEWPRAVSVLRPQRPGPVWAVRGGPAAGGTGPAGKDDGGVLRRHRRLRDTGARGLRGLLSPLEVQLPIVHHGEHRPRGGALLLRGRRKGGVSALREAGAHASAHIAGTWRRAHGRTHTRIQSGRRAHVDAHADARRGARRRARRRT